MKTAQRLRLVGALALLLPACAAPPPPKILEVVNRSRYAIVSVRETPCSGGEGRELLRDEIERGQSRGLPLHEGCVDLVAIDYLGRIVGEQRGLVPLSDVTWTVR